MSERVVAVVLVEGFNVTISLPFSCPTCYGHGTVQKPPWIAGDQLTWTGSSVELYQCPSCSGTGIIWNERRFYEV